MYVYMLNHFTIQGNTDVLKAIELEDELVAAAPKRAAPSAGSLAGCCSSIATAFAAQAKCKTCSEAAMNHVTCSRGCESNSAGCAIEASEAWLILQNISNTLSTEARL